MFGKKTSPVKVQAELDLIRKKSTDTLLDFAAYELHHISEKEVRELIMKIDSILSIIEAVKKDLPEDQAFFLNNLKNQWVKNRKKIKISQQIEAR